MAIWHHHHHIAELQKPSAIPPLCVPAKSTLHQNAVGAWKISKTSLQQRLSILIGIYLCVLMNSLKADDSSLYALIVWILPSGHATVTLTMLTSTSEAYTGGSTFSILQFAPSNFVSSEMLLNSVIGKLIGQHYLSIILIGLGTGPNEDKWLIRIS